jgi:hypothetical protein
MHLANCRNLTPPTDSSDEANFYGEWRRIENLDLATMQRAPLSPAEFTVSHPYVFSFYSCQVNAERN